MRKFLLAFIKSSLILLLPLTVAACSKPVAGFPWSLETSQVSFVSKPQPGCGIFVFHTPMRLKTARNHEETIYLACVEFLDEPLPAVGTSCKAKGIWKSKSHIDENFEISHSETLRVAYELICEGKKYKFPVMGFH